MHACMHADSCRADLFSDSHVYIWRTQTGQQVASLEAHHPGTVNCVAWHPTNHAIFASAGDDHKVRVYVSPSLRLIHAFTEAVQVVK